MSTPPRRRAAVLGLLTLLALLFTGAVAAPVAVAGPCNQSNCPEPGPDPDPGPHTPPAPVTKHRLTIKKIVCHDKNDDVFNETSDEVYIKVGGQKVWGNVSMGELDGVRYPNVTRDLVGGAGAYLGSVEVWDDDTSSGDDRIGALNYYGNGSPSEITGTFTLTGSDAHYTIEIGLRQL